MLPLANIKIFSLTLQIGIILAAVVLSFALCHAQSTGSDGSNSQQPPPEKPAESKDSKKDSKSSDPATTKLRIHVTGGEKPVGNASVYVRFPVAGGMFHRDKLTELNLKTNEDGSAKVPDIPRGKILIQVVAKGWKTYGKWYDIDSDTLTVEVKLDPPPHWY